MRIRIVVFFIVFLLKICPEYEKIFYSSEAYVRNEAISKQVWDQVFPFFIPPGDRVKIKLDKLFSKGRVIKNLSSLKKAGFTDIHKQPWTRLLIARHPNFPGLIFKLYLDSQHYHRQLPEHYFWIRRCIGASLIRKELQDCQWENLFKVPQKWIYPLPPYFSAASKNPLKYFILVEEDMELVSAKENNLLWGSKHITKESLDALFHIIQKHGFWDCARIENIPHSKDGRIAFVDTQSFHNWPVCYSKLLPALRSSLKKYWRGKIKEAHHEMD